MAISWSRSLRNFALPLLSGSQNHATTARATIGKPGILIRVLILAMSFLDEGGGAVFDGRLKE